EECDDGPGDDPDSCSQDCQIRELLVDPWEGGSEVGESAPDRWLGAGRHSVAAGQAGFIVTYVKPPPASDFDELPAVVEGARFDGRGKPLDRVPVSQGLFAVDAADPVAAELPDGAFAIAYTEFGGDGDELGIALHRLAADASEPSSVSFANEGTHATQQQPHILWTGDEPAVAWEGQARAATG